MNKKLILTGFAIFISLIFLMAPLGAASHSISPAATSSLNYQPNPSLNTQATWTSFNSSMAYNQYVNGTGKPAYLNVEPGSGDYIFIKGNDIKSTYLQGDNVSGGIWDAPMTAGTPGGLAGGSTGQFGIASSGVGNVFYLNANTSNTAETVYNQMPKNINATSFPSDNLAYDYITIIVHLTGKALTGVSGNIKLQNGTTGSPAQATILTVTPGQTAYISENLADIAKNSGLNFNLTGSNAINAVPIITSVNLPSYTSSNIYNLTVTGLALSTYPMSMGTNSTGAIITNSTGNDISLGNFKPAVPMTIINNGYTENLTQPLSVLNYTTTQTPITSGNYIEQVGYQATFGLPTGLDISYTAANFTLPLSVPADQFQALDVNGVSYLSTLGNKTNGTVVLLSSVNPTSKISYLAYVDFTPSQWQSISHPAGIFTIAGIEYYWFIAVGAIAGLLGLAGGVRHAHNKAEQTEKINRGGR